MCDTLWNYFTSPEFYKDTLANYLQGIGTIIAIIGLVITYFQLRKELKVQRDSLDLERHKRKSLIQPLFDIQVYNSVQSIQMKLTNLGGRAMEVKLTIGENLHASFGDSGIRKKFVETNGAISFNFDNTMRFHTEVAYIKFILEYKDIDRNKYVQEGIAYSNFKTDLSLPKEVEAIKMNK